MVRSVQQYLANVFWSRWKKEFLASLQARQKWTNPARNMEIGDLVLIKDSKTTRNQWPLGRIIAVFPGEDGLVRTVQVKTSASKDPADSIVGINRHAAVKNKAFSS